MASRSNAAKGGPMKVCFISQIFHSQNTPHPHPHPPSLLFKHISHRVLRSGVEQVALVWLKKTIIMVLWIHAYCTEEILERYSTLNRPLHPESQLTPHALIISCCSYNIKWFTQSKAEFSFPLTHLISCHCGSLAKGRG
jgi:hypothetical protein